MSNDYFTDTSNAVDFTRARASSVNNLSAATEAAFDLLPPPDTLDKVAKPAVLAGGTANALTIANSDPIIGYALGQRIAFKAGLTNSGAVTINVDGIGVKSLLRPDGTSVIAADIMVGRVYEAIYDGTSFQLLCGILDISDDGIGQYRAEIEGYAEAASDDADVANEAADEATDARIAAEEARDQAVAAAGSVNPAGLLASIKTVDGSGSGLDADIVRGTTPGAGGLSVLSGADALAVKTTLSLENANNTSDANKPISTATQAALDLKAPLAAPTLTGQVKFADGTVTAPSITNDGDTNTGIYFSSADTLDIAVAGVNRLQVTTSGVTTGAPLLTTNGSASAPSHSFTNSANSGMWYDPAGVTGIKFQLNGNTILTLRSAVAVFSGALLTLGGTNTPSSSGASGSAGTICFDANYAYFCVATDTWKRVALSSF